MNVVTARLTFHDVGRKLRATTPTSLGSQRTTFPSMAEHPESLAQIATQWSLLRLAHEDAVAGSAAARQALLLRYSRAVRRFVGFLVKDPAAADDVAQDAMVRMMRGDFAKADATRGRFRDLMRQALRNMVRNLWAKENRRAGEQLDDEQVAGEDPGDDPWLSEWTNVVLEAAWRGLEEYQRQTKGSIAHTVLKLRTSFPDEDSEQLAARLSAALNRPLNAAATRQQLRRARLRFAQLLVEETARGLANPTPEAVEEELTDLGLMPYVRDFLPADWRTLGQLRAEDE